MQNKNLLQSYHLAGLFTLTLRLVVGWTYFSAFWRRLILENKLSIRKLRVILVKNSITFYQML